MLTVSPAKIFCGIIFTETVTVWSLGTGWQNRFCRININIKDVINVILYSITGYIFFIINNFSLTPIKINSYIVSFLILPWVKVKNLASKLLSISARIVPSDWHKYYNFHPVMLETFVETQRFTGASYKAANWIYLGQTKGKGRSGMNYYYHSIIKDIYIYPLLKP